MSLPCLPATRYLTPLREGGSLPAIVDTESEGLWVVKFRGAGQGAKALVAEVLAGELARAAGLPVPELVWIDLDPALGAAEPDPEIQELIAASAGRNVGLDYLPGSLTYSPAAGPPPPDPELAAEIVWFDALMTNVDRSPQNPNLLLWHGRLWLIDHGAALYLQHAWEDPPADARRRFPAIGMHVLLPCAGDIAQADARLAPRLTREVVEGVTALVPADWYAPRDRAQYAEYLCRRLEGPRGFAAEAEEARRGAR